MEEIGNDYPLAVQVKKRGGYTYQVKGWEDTRTRLEEFPTPPTGIITL